MTVMIGPDGSDGFRPAQRPQTYLCSQVQDQVFYHLPKGFGESQQLVEEVVTSPEANNVDHPHSLKEKEKK